MRLGKPWLRAWITSAVIGLAGAPSCFEEDPPPSDAGTPDGGALPAVARVDYGSATLWDAPWPDERMRRADGRVGVAAFPNPRGVPIVTQLTSILEGAAGFGTSSPIYFPLSGPIDPASLPDAHGSVDLDASVFVVDVDPASPERGEGQPVVAAFYPDLGPYAVPNVLGVLPLQGRPLHPGRLYAAVLTTRVRGADGTPLEIAPATAAIARGERPEGMSEAAFSLHEQAMRALEALGVPLSEVAATAVLRTWDPRADLSSARDDALSRPLPTPEGAFAAREIFDEYCVFHATIRMPVYQEGEPPYLATGGRFVRDASGALVEQRRDLANVWITVPRQAMPEQGFPTAVFIRTGGGGDRPLVDRGMHPEAGGIAPPGTGPALQFARAGYAGVSVDGPLGGLRNLEGWDEQFAIFNINNPEALRDTIGQSALELMLLAHVLETIDVDASSCAGVTTPAGDASVRLDTTRLAIMGHSMGATIAPLVVALEPRYRALILSGAGGSWIANVLYKESPIRVRPVADALLRYSGDRTVTMHDPALALLQWAGESADPQVYARSIVEEPAGEPRHVLMFQGILDTYIPPPVANALSLALGLDLGGDELDRALSELYEPVGPFLDLAGGARVELPIGGNRVAGAVTAVLVQHPEDGIEDGHEIVYQRPSAHLQYRCFLEGLRAGVPRVASPGSSGCE